MRKVRFFSVFMFLVLLGHLVCLSPFQHWASRVAAKAYRGLS